MFFFLFFVSDELNASWYYYKYHLRALRFEAKQSQKFLSGDKEFQSRIKFNDVFITYIFSK